MNPDVLRTVKNFCKTKGDIVWILDQDWKFVWKSCVYEGEKSIREFLNVPEDCWENIKKRIYWKGSYFNCEMICSKEDNYRAIVLDKIKISDILPFNNKAVFQALHCLKLTKDDIEKYIHLNNLHEKDDSLKAMNGSLYLIYRGLYIQQLLDSLEQLEDTRTFFGVDFELRKICRKAKEIFGDFAKIKLEINDEKGFFIFENEKLFCAMILSGIVLCCTELQQQQKLKITLHYTEEEVTILIDMKAMQKMRKDWQLQGSTEYYNKSSGDEILLDVFCKRHNGNWSIIDKQERGQTHRYCKITFKPDEKVKMAFSSSAISKSEKGFFDIYHVMLARICVKSDDILP